MKSAEHADDIRRLMKYVGGIDSTSKTITAFLATVSDDGLLRAYGALKAVRVTKWPGSPARWDVDTLLRDCLTELKRRGLE